MSFTSVISHLAALSALIAYFASALRLLSFQRSGARYRHGISLLASLLIATLLCAGLEILLYQPPISPWQSAIAVLLCILICRSRGNLAALLRPSQ